MTRTSACQLCIFDLDGTLLDTLEDLATAANLALLQLGFPGHSQVAYTRFIGSGLRVLMERILPPGSSADLIERCTAIFSSEYQKIWNRTSHPYAGINELLAQLLKAGVKLAVLSNKPHDFTVRCVQYYFPHIPFAAVFGQRPEIPRKPDPTAVLEIMNLTGATVTRSLFIGDSAIDIQTGQSAGMTAVGVAWGFRGNDELIASKADLIVSTPKEIYQHVCTF